VLLSHYELKIEVNSELGFQHGFRVLEVNSELGFQHDLGFWKAIKEGSAT
jgi:hypothetical protein